MITPKPLSLLLLAASSMAAPCKRAGDQTSGAHSVAGVGTFTTYANYDFSSLKALPSGLQVGLDHIGGSDTAKAQKYDASNVYVQNGVLNMKVPGGQAGQDTIQGAQINTADKFLYGSIRTYAKVSAAGGTCSGFFSYNNANYEESDIEILTSNLTRMHYTNQNPQFHISGGQAEVTHEGPMPADPTTTFHEYRTDWLPGKVRWYLDGKFQTEIDTYAPKTATPWVWNNWSNGDHFWSAGPPTTDNVLEIQRIEMYYNATGKA